MLSEVSLALGYHPQNDPMSYLGKIVVEDERGDPLRNIVSDPPPPVKKFKEMRSKALMSLPNSPLTPPPKSASIAINDREPQYFKSIGSGV